MARLTKGKVTDLVLTLESFAVDERLAVYGSLRPGGNNHHLLGGIDGTWVPALVSGTLHHAGWAAEDGYPGLRLSDTGPLVEVLVFCSFGLPSLWAQLDEFEGPDYRRRRAPVLVGANKFLVNIYELAAGPD